MRIALGIITGFIALNALAVISPAQLLPYRSETNGRGWSVPLRKELKLTKRSDIKQSDGSVLLKKTYNAQLRQPSTLVEKFKKGTRISSIRRCEFSWVHKYSVNGKTFAVDGTCVMVDYQYARSNGVLISIKDYLSGITRYTFYDEDGDGKFERRYNSSPGDKKFQILIPGWVNKKDSSQLSTK